MTTSSFSLAVVICLEQQKHAKCLPVLTAVFVFHSCVHSMFVGWQDWGLCRENKGGEDDQDSTGGSTSSSTGFGSFVRIASASSNIWKKSKEDYHKCDGKHRDI